MSYRFHPEAEAELDLSIDYYESIESGLGYDFAIEVYETIQRVVDFPKAWPILGGDVRRSLVKRFPYGGAASA
ncbi:type II toxin-antitoxin system RelE/ParE family toxin [Thiococcus pfennigii]|uniref:type II toxin-antitoxin system RelE/ParE family toxin n=1 Tax=Thiococcus pfennigii TaxID=1057 RepID=UPI0019056E4E|nr:type II toxin-antitoxin system RelE/ParE family toxin [Thiococcus pfennigii]MBK1700718.1 plasmid stabilization protein [Thiococcus pfennigii]